MTWLFLHSCIFTKSSYFTLQSEFELLMHWKIPWYENKYTMRPWNVSRYSSCTQEGPGSIPGGRRWHKICDQAWITWLTQPCVEFFLKKNVSTSTHYFFYRQHSLQKLWFLRFAARIWSSNSLLYMSLYGERGL